MTRRHLNLLIDTNVWLDYFLGRKNAKVTAKMLQRTAENEDAVATAPSIIKDVFYLVCATLKRRALASGEDASRSAKAINEIGWACISAIQNLSVIVPQGFGQHLDAVVFKSNNKDYEDNLLLATAQNAKIDFIVTYDRELLKNKIIPTMTPKDYLKAY